MPDPVAAFPPEIQMLVLENVMDGRPDMDLLHSGKVPEGLAVVSSKWNEMVTYSLYSHYCYDGSCAQVESLWKFFRTIITNPELAQHVQQITFVTGSQLPPAKVRTRANFFPNLLREHYGPFRQAFDQAFTAFGPAKFDNLLQRAEMDLNLGIMAPLEALIMAHCPNLTRLMLNMGEFDLYLQTILDGALGRSPVPPAARAFQKLELLYLGPKGALDWSSPRLVHFHDAFVGGRLPFYLLPTLKELMVVMADPAMVFALPPGTTTPSAIERLTIRYSQRQGGNMQTVKNLAPFLRHTSKLKHLGLHFENQDGGESTSVHRELWSAISHLKESLEYLDLCFEDPSAVEAQTSQRAVCPPYSKFTNLRQLNTSVTLLYGYLCKHPTPGKLHSHLPPKLESLGIYWDDALTFFEVAPLMRTELENLVLEAPTLRSIVVDIDENEFDRSGEPPPVDKIRKAAEDRGVQFSPDPLPFLLVAGRNTPFGWTTYHCQIIQREGFENLVKVAEAIPRGMTVYGFKGQLK